MTAACAPRIAPPAARYSMVTPWVSMRSEEARAGTNRWIALFASACRRAAEDAGRFEEQVRAHFTKNKGPLTFLV